VVLQRLKSPSDRTNGILTLPDGGEIKTLERPWKDNEVGVSCIPAGFYKFMRDTHGRFQWFRVLDVPGRTHIEFHEGTKPSHSEGCILMSNADLKTLKWWCGNESIKYVLEIKDIENGVRKDTRPNRTVSV
jgi:hypothetical protein